MPPRDIRVPMAPLLTAFGVECTVVRPAPDNEPIECTGVWLPPETVDLPDRSEWQRRDQIRVMAFDLDDVPTLPVGTLITAPERKGDAEKIWIVDGIAPSTQAIDRDQIKGIVRLHDDTVT